MNKPVGILGGMGPAATVDLFDKIISNTNVNKDQDHIPIVVYNNPQIPSRIDAVLHNDESPLNDLIYSAKQLVKLDVEFIVIPCHTAHYWYDELIKAINTPIINMIEVTFKMLDANTQFKGKNVLLLASPATVKTGIYQKKFENSNVNLLIPSHKEQQTVTRLILEVKKGIIPPATELKELEEILEKYENEGTVGIIGGCTEIPLIFPYLINKMTKIDPTLQLAKKIIELKSKQITRI